jgi:hypothetical protein
VLRSALQAVGFGTQAAAKATSRPAATAAQNADNDIEENVEDQVGN